MKVDVSISEDIEATRDEAARHEAEGYDGLWISETKQEPFLQSLRAVDATERVSVGTAVAIGFARTPMTLASIGHDLARYSRGRFVLGLGSQVKPHIERRFSMPWSHPAPRMRELILAMRAIWACWQGGERLSFRGDFYTHTLMTPFFSPPAHPYGTPPVFLAAVGPAMTEVAGEVADGFLVHPLTTRRFLDEVTFPALRRGRAKAGRDDLSGFTVSGLSFVAVGRDETELAAAVAGTKERIAFYASTPAYRAVLELHGWADVQPELSELARAGRWAAMGSLITDEMLDAFAVVGEPAEVGKALARRLDGVCDRTTLYAPYEADPAIWPVVVDALRAA